MLFYFLMALSALIGCMAEANSATDYFAALKAADRHLETQRSLESGAVSPASPGALTAPAPGLWASRFAKLRPGETWSVLAVRIATAQMRRLPLDVGDAPKAGFSSALFRFRYLGEAQGLFLLEVMELEKREKILLTFDRSGELVEKVYELQTPTGVSTARVSAQGLRSGVIPWEQYPFDPQFFLKVELARAAPPRDWDSRIAALPAVIRDQLSSHWVGAGTDGGRAEWIEQSDFFGRPVRLLWRSGESWPSYYSDSRGMAFLLKKGRAQ